MPLYYADSSALVKLIVEEPESDALEAFLTGAELVSCELVLAEVPRAIRMMRLAGRRLESVLAQADELLDELGIIELDAALLAAAGAIEEVSLRTLDAIHLAAALRAVPIEGFVSYDHRQSAVARLAGLRTVAPGA